MTPRTLEEWAEYISTLRGETLHSKAVAANTLSFVQTLQEEGFEPNSILKILIKFALQFLEDDQAVPLDMPGQYLSYPDLLSSIGK